MLPHDFLIEIAEQYGLTNKEQEVFLAKFGSDKSDQQIAHQLSIADGTFRTRMSGVYRKFKISDSGPVKSERLLRFLANQYKKSNPSVSSSYCTIDHSSVSNTQKKLVNMSEILANKLANSSINHQDVFKKDSMKKLKEKILEQMVEIQEKKRRTNFSKVAASWLSKNREYLADFACKKVFPDGNYNNKDLEKIMDFNADIEYYLHLVYHCLDTFSYTVFDNYKMATYQAVPLNFYIKAFELIKFSHPSKDLPLEAYTEMSVCLDYLINTLRNKLSG